MKKSDIQQMPEYFDRYIHKTDDVTYLEALEISLKELENLPIEKYNNIGNHVYAPGKWTIKDILQHLIDTERVFSYRVTAFARIDGQKMLLFDEDSYAKNADANHRNIEDIVEELILLRKSSIAQFRSFTAEMLMRSGRTFNDKECSVLSLAFMIAGHQRWHMQVVNEKYF